MTPKIAEDKIQESREHLWLSGVQSHSLAERWQWHFEEEDRNTIMDGQKRIQ